MRVHPAERRLRFASFRWFAAYGVFIFFAFPHPIGDRVLDLGFVLAPLAPACLIVALEGLGVRAALRRGFVASLLGHVVFFHWFYVVTVEYGHASPFLGILSPLAPSIYISVFTAAFAGGWAWLREQALANPLSGALLWTTLDHFRGFALGGFPWATLGYAEHANTGLLWITRFTGVYGLSFLVVLLGAALANGWIARTHPGGRRITGLGDPVWVLIAVAIGIAFLHLPGILEEDPAPAATTIRVGAIQGNIDQGAKWSSERAEEILDIYLDLSRRAIESGAEVVVWPETAVPGLIEFESESLARIQALACRSDVVFVVGAAGARLDPSGTRLAAVYDSAFVVTGNAGLGERYDKSHLVPFGEYVPLRALLGSFFKALATGISSTDVASGPAPRAIDLPRLRGAGTPARVGIPICYELLFPDLVRRFSADGARVLFAITNDAWYGRTGAPYQFLAMTALRSAETGLWTVRAANSGVTAVIDARGRVRVRTRIFERDVVVSEVPLLPEGARGTFYVRHGDVFAGVCWLGTVGLGIVASIRPVRRRQEDARND